MALELVPPSVTHDENITVVWVPEETTVNPLAPTAAILNAATRVTYSMTSDGWQEGHSQETETDQRLGLRNQLESPGRESDTLTTVHNYGSEDDVMDPLIASGNKGHFFVRRSVPNEEDFSATDKVDHWGVTNGKPGKTVTNGKQTKTTKHFVSAYNPDVAVAAS